MGDNQLAEKETQKIYSLSLGVTLYKAMELS